MTQGRRSDPNAALYACEQWPAMFVLPARLNERLNTCAAETRAATNHRVFKRDIVAALIACRAPQHPDELEALWHNLLGSGLHSLIPDHRNVRHVTVVVPSPVSLRLDRLVERLRDRAGPRVGRSDLLSSLVHDRCPTDPQTALALHIEYAAATAGQLTIPGEPPENILSLRRPKAGPRSARARARVRRRA